MRQSLGVGPNANKNEHTKYHHEAPSYAELVVERSVTPDGRHKLKLRHQRLCVFDRTCDTMIPDAVVDEIRRTCLHFLEMPAATPKQWGRLRDTNWAMHNRLGQPGSNWNGKLISQPMMTCLLVAETGRFDKFSDEEAMDETPVAANDAAATVAKIMVTETAGLAAVKAARHDEPKAANDDDEVLLTTSETAEVLEVSAHTVRKWTIEGRPIIGRRRKKKDALKAKQVGGHLRFEAASVHALANKLKAYGLR